jgi:phosphoglycolate phosphatase-like HAD superfamily hydrolase
VGEPPDLKRPRAKKDEERMSLQQWRELREERRAKYQELYLSSKIDALVPDVVRILAEGEKKKVKHKVIVYSNFDASFDHIKTRLKNEGIAYQYGPCIYE